MTEREEWFSYSRLVQVLPWCKKTRDGRRACGFCGEIEGLRQVFSPAHDATLLEHRWIVQVVRRGQWL